MGVSGKCRGRNGCVNAGKVVGSEVRCGKSNVEDGSRLRRQGRRCCSRHCCRAIPFNFLMFCHCQCGVELRESVVDRSGRRAFGATPGAAGAPWL
eukprot:998728-Rhodomonas_salina.2